VPDRSGLPELSRYAHLVLPDGSTRVSGFVEGSRGCKHLCRHCPVVPVYQGSFRIVPVHVVLEDMAQQVRDGATHVSFGDPDFFNGPAHGLRLARALHDAFPSVTFDATIKIQHLIAHAQLLPELRRCGCMFITSAVEAVDDGILRLLAKNHTSRDFDRAVALTRAAGISLAPTFVAFTPWTTLDGYIALLERLLELQLVESVPPVQLCIRLLIPEGSYLLQLPGFKEQLLRSIPSTWAIRGCMAIRASTHCSATCRRWSPDPRRSACRAAKCSPRYGSCPTRLRSVRYPRSVRTSDLQFRACRSLGTVAPSRPTSSCSPSEGADP
jgi:hypothetical protein